MENKGISNKLDAWLAFLSMDSPEMIHGTVQQVSQSLRQCMNMYNNICQNVEKVDEHVSEELKNLDQNTVR